MLEHLALKAIGALLTFLGDMLIKLLDLIPDHSAERLRKRRAKLQLKRGLQLLTRKSIQEADIHFGAALNIQPDIMHVLSKREIRRIIAILKTYGGGPNAAGLWFEISNYQLKKSQHS